MRGATRILGFCRLSRLGLAHLAFDEIGIDILNDGRLGGTARGGGLLPGIGPAGEIEAPERGDDILAQFLGDRLDLVFGFRRRERFPGFRIGWA